MARLHGNLSELEIGLLTREQFLDAGNPDDKSHPSSAYRITLDTFWRNRTVQDRGGADGHRRGDYWTVRGNAHGELLYLQRANKEAPALFGVLHDGTLYLDHWMDPRYVPRVVGRSQDRHALDWDRVVMVKYPEEYRDLVDNPGQELRRQFPVVLQNFMVDGEAFQVRAETTPRVDAGDSLIVTRTSDGRAVAEAANEWGAILVHVVEEYQRKGLGERLAHLWYGYNPSFRSGGFTPAGRATAIRVWAARVRELLANGQYTQWVRAGVVTQEQVEQILAGLPAAPSARASRPRPAAPAMAAPTGNIRVYLDDLRDPVGFVVYDARFLDEQDDRYILAHGFFRDAENIGTFLYAIDYDRQFAALATAIALQMARDAGEPIYVGPGYADFLEWELVEGAVREGDYVYLTEDVLDLREAGKVERAQRKPVDPYRQIEFALLEQANAKWQ